MERLRKVASPLEVALSRIKKKEETSWGKIQQSNHRWLALVENSSWLPRPGILLASSPSGPYGSHRNPIDVDSLLILSVILHLLVFLLVSRITVSSVPGEDPQPIAVRFIELPKSSVKLQKRQDSVKASMVQAAPVQRSNGRSATEIIPEQTTPPPQAPPLPGPKILPDARRERMAAAIGQPAEKWIQLPTRQSSPDQPAASAPGGGPLTSAGGGRTDYVPEKLRQGQSGQNVNGRDSSPLSDPDFGPYLKLIEKRIKSIWEYPDGISGVHRVDVVFVLDRGGNLTQARIVDSTNRLVDESALQAMKLASPFPPIPDRLKDLAGMPLRLRLSPDFGIKP